VSTHKIPAVHLALLAAALLLANACATPIGVNRVDHTVVYREITRSALSSDEPSVFSHRLLSERGLDRRFEEEPEAVLKELHGTGDIDPDTLFALAELSFLHGERAHKPEYHLAAAVYALAFVTHPEWRSVGLIANAVDPRTRMACDLYNLGLVSGLRVPTPPVEEGQPEPPPEVSLEGGVLPLPFGQLELRTVPETFLWGGYRFSRFISTSEYEIRGLRNRYRQPGVGAPLLAELTPLATGARGEEDRKRIPPQAKVPVTAIVKMPSVHEGLVSGQISGTIEVHSADAGPSVMINGTRIPVELDPTAAIAYMLEGSPVWDTELGGFLKGNRPVFGDGLIMMQPYRPGRVPVVLIHGTASSPARWAEIVNEVQNDPLLWERVQIWLFNYNTSNPILYSASLLRDALEKAVREFDPDGRDPALHRMVLMGHSQGGLLTRLMVTDSGSRFWDAAVKVPFADIRGTPEERALLKKVVFFEPLPFVTRVVFMATPHKGSFRVTGPVLNLVRRVVTLPLRLVQPVQNLLELNPGVFVGSVKGLPTAVDNMNPTNRFIRTLSASPIAPGVTAHSIIAVQGKGDLSRLNDTVVRYESAHLEGVESEKIVQSSHSMQSQPETILEVRRILREHLGIQ